MRLTLIGSSRAMPKVAFKQCDVARALRAGKQAGERVRVMIDTAGRLHVIPVDVGAPLARPLSEANEGGESDPWGDWS